MELFHESGCLTDEGLHAVIDGTLDEMQRLEAAEHLSFCDDCLVRYTDLLTDDVLVAPKETLVPSVMKRVKNKAVQIFFNRYTRVAAAVALAMLLWSIGTFDYFVPSGKEMKSGIPEQPTAPISTSRQIKDFFESAHQKIYDSVQQIFSQEENIQENNR